jgi:membrane protease YdiL (CAAX protease family)
MKGMRAAAGVAAFVLAEVLAAIVDVRVGAALHATLVIVFANLYLFRPAARSRSLVAVLAIASLSRLVAVAMPLTHAPLAQRVALVGTPLLLAIVLIRGLPDVDWRNVRLRPRSWALQGLIGLSGAPLGFASFRLLRPDLGLSGGSATAFLGAGLSLSAFSALPEELLFRGLLVPAARQSFGRAGPVAATAVFTSAYIGTRALPFLALVTLTSVFFGWCYERTSSLVGVVVAHCLINVSTFLIVPRLMGLRGLT